MRVNVPQAVAATTFVTVLCLLFVAGTSLASSDAWRSGGDASTTSAVERRDLQWCDATYATPETR